MIEDPPSEQLAKEVGVKAERKLRAQRDGGQGIWFGLGTMGLIGWSVAVPAIIGAGIGLWLDAHYPGGHRWALAMLVGGLVLGCFNAWRWVEKQDLEMRRHD